MCSAKKSHSQGPADNRARHASDARSAILRRVADPTSVHAIQQQESGLYPRPAALEMTIVGFDSSVERDRIHGSEAAQTHEL